VTDFFQKQVEASEKLLQAMIFDQKERLEEFSTWAQINAQLIRKLDERDKLISELRKKIQAYEAVEAR
jgi:dihydroorotase